MKRSLRLAKFYTKFLKEKKCKDVVLLTVRKLTTICDYLIISTVESSAQMRSIVNALSAKLKKMNAKQLGYEGTVNDKWVVLDYGSVIIHLMFPEVREFYAIDKLFSNAKGIKV